MGGGTGSYVTRSHVRLSRRGVEACHMVGVKNKEDLFYVVAAPGYFNGGEGNGDRPAWLLAAATFRWHRLSPSLVIVGDIKKK